MNASGKLLRENLSTCRARYFPSRSAGALGAAAAAVEEADGSGRPAPRGGPPAYALFVCKQNAHTQQDTQEGRGEEVSLAECFDNHDVIDIY